VLAPLARRRQCRAAHLRQGASVHSGPGRAAAHRQPPRKIGHPARESGAAPRLTGARTLLAPITAGEGFAPGDRMPELRPTAVALLLLPLLAGGCFFGRQNRDIDRTPIVDHGVGATILMPGQSAPSLPPGSGAPTSNESTTPGSGASGSLRSTGTPGSGAGLSTIGGTRVDEVTHAAVREEPIWFKYVTLPFAIVAAPFVAAADAVKGEEEPGPEVPRVDPPRPERAAPAPVESYDERMLDGLERELAERATPPVGSAPPEPASGRTNAAKPPSIADELAALQRAPRATPEPSAPQPRAAEPTAGATPAAEVADGIVDRNEDGRIDLWIYRENGEIVRRVLDEDFDGRPDQTILYDRVTHRVSRVEEDTDKNGRPDTWTDYQEGELARRRADANHDGTVDTWIFYREGEVSRHEQDTTGDGFRDRVGFYEAGKLVREEEDSTGSGKPDVIVHYDAKERVVRREQDTNHDGRIDVISYYEKGRLTRRELIDAAQATHAPLAAP
jgi:hypothetical protein